MTWCKIKISLSKNFKLNNLKINIEISNQIFCIQLHMDKNYTVPVTFFHPLKNINI